MIEDLINYYLILFGKVLRKKNVGKKTANNLSISSFKRINLNKIDGKDNAIIIIVR